MNLRDPKLSRGLARLIQYVESDYHNQFVDDAAEAKNIREFLEKFEKYPKIKLNF